MQILPKIQPLVDHLTAFIRSPSWILPLIGSGQHIYTKEETDSFVQNPGSLTTLRKINEATVNSIFSEIHYL